MVTDPEHGMWMGVIDPYTGKPIGPTVSVTSPTRCESGRLADSLGESATYEVNETGRLVADTSD